MTITIYELLIILTFIIISLMTIIHIVESLVPTLAEILKIANTIPCYYIKVYRNGKLLRYSEWLKYLYHGVNYYELKDGILYVQIS